jgi:glutamate-5-semialdehyde dehydrogenase
VQHINRHGAGLAEVIVTPNADRASLFESTIDAAVVYSNASTRFTCATEFGMGADIGISTDKLHARGPMGIEDLTTYTFAVRGKGQTE